MPCIGSTTMPASRRSSPQTCSTSSASWRPSTQIRLAAATFAGPAGPATEPDAVVAAPALGLDGRPAQRHRAALEQEAARLPREVALVVAAVAQRDGLERPPDDVAAPPAGPVLDDHAAGDDDLRVGPRLPGIGDLVQDVALVGRHGRHGSTGTAGHRGTSHTHGEPTHHSTSNVTRRIATVGAVAGVLVLTACAGSDGDDAATSADRTGDGGAGRDDRHRRRRRRRRRRVRCRRPGERGVRRCHRARSQPAAPTS